MRYHRARQDTDLRILVVTARPPWPPRRGDQARTAGLVETLRAHHDLRVVALHPPGFSASPPPPGIAVDAVPTGLAGQLLAIASHLGQPVQVAMHQLAPLERAVASAAAAFRPDVALIVLSRLGGLVSGLAGVPVVLDFIDSLALNLENRAVRQPLAAPLLRREARLIARWDRALVRQIAFGTVVCRRDRDTLAQGDPDLAERVAVVPFGVAVPERPPGRSVSRNIVLLSGNLGYFPTVDGAQWFAAEVWPRVRKGAPEAEWWLAGARPARAVRRLGHSAGISLFPDPDSLGQFQEQATVAVAPMRSGSGTPIKVLEAMACGLPVVATPTAAAGLDDVPPGALTVAADAESFAAAVRQLLADRDRAGKQAATAWAWVRSTHSLKTAAASFESLFARATSGRD